MKTRLARLLLPGIAVLIIAAVSRAQLPEPDPNDPPVDVHGRWIIYSKNIDNDETVEKPLEITQDHHHISGYFKGPNQQGKIHGVVNGRRVVFQTQTKNMLTFRGEADGDTITGLYGIHGRHGQFRAVRQH